MGAMTLTVSDHDRARAGRRYVYPVVSRRAGGVSVGINLNPTTACNWRCLYCQVPDLARGGPPPLDLPLLERELREVLEEILHGDFMAAHVPEGMRRLNDVAFSGNGEPTSAPEFPEAVAVAGRVLAGLGLAGTVRVVLITNGSLVHRPAVQEGLRRLAALGGEVWFKVDRATAVGVRTVNGVAQTPERMARNLARSAALCPTWVQTCLFALDGAPPDEAELTAYLDFLRARREEGVVLQGVLLYGLARRPMLPEGVRCTPLGEAWMAAFAARVEALGLTVTVSP